MTFSTVFPTALLTAFPTAFPLETVHIVVVFNCLLAGAIFALAYGLWGYKRQLQRLSGQLYAMAQTGGLGSKQLGYTLTLRRVQLAATRLEMARWQQRSQQVAQVVGLVRLIQTVLLYRARRRKG
ncbi:MAG: hypothetical protein WA783_05010 [Phormidesmis sp.]